MIAASSSLPYLSIPAALRFACASSLDDELVLVQLSTPRSVRAAPDAGTKFSLFVGDSVGSGLLDRFEDGSFVFDALGIRHRTRGGLRRS